MNIRRLGPDDAGLYLPLRRRGLVEEPHSFGASPEDDHASSETHLRQTLADQDQVIFGAFAPALVGTVGIYRDRLIKARHKAHIWGMYVSPEGRRQGTGRRLMEAALQWAQEQEGIVQVHLIVSARTPVARKLYESLGFRVWGTEPRALRIMGELVDDEHMIKILPA